MSNLELKIQFLKNKEKIFDTELIQDNFDSDFKSKISKIMTSFSTAYNDLISMTEAKEALMAEKLLLSNEINDLESYFDKQLGQIFATIQFTGEGFKCFSKSQLSYIFFNMVKTNVIINEEDFLLMYLKNIAYINAKDLMLSLIHI